MEQRERTFCVCGHPTHFSECACGCHLSDPDDGTDGPSTAPGPHHASDPYNGIYGTNQRYPRGEAS